MPDIIPAAPGTKIARIRNDRAVVTDVVVGWRVDGWVTLPVGASQNDYSNEDRDRFIVHPDGSVSDHCGQWFRDVDAFMERK
jgi:hypothetical protein